MMPLTVYMNAQEYLNIKVFQGIINDLRIEPKLPDFLIKLHSSVHFSEYDVTGFNPTDL